MSNMRDILPYLQNRLVEICVGTEYEEIVLADHNQKINGAIFGILKDIVGDFIYLHCYFVDKNGQLKSGCEVFINCIQITAMVPITANGGSLSDVMLGVSSINKIKKVLEIE